MPSHKVLAAGASVVVVTGDSVVVFLAGSDKEQDQALKAAARFPSVLLGVHGLVNGTDVAVFARNAT